MAEAGEIPATKVGAKDGVVTADDEKPEEGEVAEVVAAAVVDENDEEGSTGSGSVVVAKIIDDEAPPTPNTAKIEKDLAKKLPSAAVNSSKKVLPLAAKKKDETDSTPVKKNMSMPSVDKDKADTAEKPVEVAVKTAASSEKAAEAKDSGELPKKNPEGEGTPSSKEGTSKPAVIDQGRPKEKKNQEPIPDEKAVAAKDKKADEADKAEPMDVEPPPTNTAKKDDDTEVEEGEVEEGEVEEGEIEDKPAPEDTKKAPTEVKEKQETKDEGQTNLKAEEGNSKDSDAKEDGEVNEEPMEVDEPKAKESLKESPKVSKPKAKESPKEAKPKAKEIPEESTTATKPKAKESPKNSTKDTKPKAKDGPKNSTTAIPNATSALKKGIDKEEDEDEDDDEEDGEIKEDTDEEGEIKEETEEEGEIKDDTEEEGEVKEDPVKQVAVKEDAEMEDALSQSEEGADRDEDMDTASNDGDTVSLVDESSSRKVEPTYSTRGRASGSNTPVPRGSESVSKGSHSSAGGGKTEQWERSVREALEDLGRGKDAPPAGVGPGGASFLEALGEEERRTRTRFLPAVDGVHMLRKTEIKGDLALARSIMSSAGNVASVASVAAGASSSSSVSKKSKKKKHQDGGGEAEAMDADDSSVLSSSEDDPNDLGGRVGNASSIEVDPGDHLMVPSSSFVPPPDATFSAAPTATNGEKKEDGTPVPVVSTGIKGILNNQRNIKSPRVVEAVMAFNPPRPPESVGKKKQHRMLRWERRPADVEVDLNNYRKTVDRTRKELHTAEDELDRIEATSNHLRRHFLGHLQCMDKECDEILTEFNAVQQKCVNVADLLTSRTRSRGAGKGSYVMRDVLAVLKARGAEIKEKGIEMKPAAKDAPNKFVGIGGVGGAGFADLNQHSVVASQRIASAWVLPGDKVTTPYGDGVVVNILENAAPNVKEASKALAKASSNGQSPSKMDVDTPTTNSAKSSPNSGGKKSGAAKGAAKKKIDSGLSSEELSSFLGTRIGVRLPFGVGYFSPAVVASTEAPETLSDAQLAKRWSGIVESALSQAGRLDLNGMTLPDSARKVLSGSQQSATAEGGEGAVPMDIEGNTNSGNTDPETKLTPESVPSASDKKLLPFASRLLPTGTGRGNELSEMNAQKLQKALKPALTDGEGVLGDKANEGVPTIVKSFEEERQESYILQAKVFQLRNELYRQRRIRTLNERTSNTTKERSSRVESLVAEMRTDLKSLRNRLDEELVELGIDQDGAEAILKAYYLSHEYGEHQEADVEDHQTSPTQKRARVETGDKKGDQPGEGQKAHGVASAGVEGERQKKRAKVDVR